MVPAEGGGIVVAYKFKAYRKPLPQVGTPRAPEAVTEGKVPSHARQMMAELEAAIAREQAKGP